MEQIDDQLQLVQTLEVRDLGLVPRGHERLEPRDDELGHASAEDGLLAEEIRLRLLGEGRLQHARARAADAVRIGECRIQGVPSRVLVDGHETGDAAPFGVLPPDQIARRLRSDEHDVDPSRSADLTEVHVEAVGEQERAAFAQRGGDLLPEERRLRGVGDEHRHYRGVAYGFERSDRAEAIGGRPLGRRSVRSEPDDDVDARVAEIERLGASLAAVAEDRDTLSVEVMEVGSGSGCGCAHEVLVG